MRVVLTGATGFIGRALCAKLVEHGDEVIALTRSPTRAQGLLGDAVRSIKWDGCSARGWASLADGAGAIINLAGENISRRRWNRSVKHAILQSRLDAGRAIVQAVEVASVKPKVVIQASGVGYYGSRGDERVDESWPSGDDFLSDVACQWEASTKAVEEVGVRHAVIRTGAVLEKEGGVLPRLLLPFRLFLGWWPGGGQAWFSWIHRDDEVEAIRFLIGNDEACGVFNLTAPEPVKVRDFCRLLGHITGRPAWLPVPGFALRLLLGEMAEVLLLSGQRALPRRLQEAGFHFKYPTAATALKAILASHWFGEA